MPIPNFDGCVFPLLRVLAQHPDGLRTRDAVDKTADDLKISDAERRLVLASGNDLVYRNRIAWAHHHLKAAGLTASPRWGFWRITDAGRDVVQQHPDGFDDATLKKVMGPGYKKGASDGTPLSSKPDGRKPVPTAVVRYVPEGTPDERIGEALREIEHGVAHELLELLGRGSPEFFEKVVLRVLQAMGYGAGEQDVEHTGGCGDGGVDGVIYLDRLGLQKVCVQAKRWQGSVGPAEVQAFFGALAQRRAHHGVMITTGVFSKAARSFADQVSDKIVLVDGEQLANLMIERGVGVSHQELRLPKIDRDFFEEA